MTIKKLYSRERDFKQKKLSLVKDMEKILLMEDYCNTDEVELYKNIARFLKWNLQRIDMEGRMGFYQNFLPIMINKKRIILYDKNVTTYKTNYSTFRPLFNNAHAQYLLEILMNEKNIHDIHIEKIEKENGDIRFSCLDETRKLKVSNCITETEAKLYFFIKCFKIDKLYNYDKILTMLNGIINDTYDYKIKSEEFKESMIIKKDDKKKK